MSKLKKFSKDWITCNCCDQCDRSEVDGDKHIFTSKELYELVDDIIDDFDKENINQEFVCGNKQATFGGVVITCGEEHQCDACCRRERDALAAKVELFPKVKAEAIGKAMESIDMMNFKMANKTDPVVLRYMGELARYADNLIKEQD